MKALKAMTAGLLAFFLVSVASAATTTVHITGSTAFRKAVVIAIQNILQSGYTYGYIGSNVTGANQSTFVGTTKTTNIPVVIKCSWAGSVGGVHTIAVDNLATVFPYISETGNTLTTTGASLDASTAVTDPAYTTGAEVAMSDVFQSSTQFYGPGYNTLVNTNVGVVPFVWTKGQSNDPEVQAAAAKLTNMTPLLAKLVYNGGAPLSMFTGNSADSNIMVYGMGRDEDSGTRLTSFAETGIGIFSFPLQYQATISGGAVTAIAAWPASTVLGINYPAGHSGYAGGGQLAAALNAPVDVAARDDQGKKFILVGYFGTNDANGVNSGKNNLTYNGVPYSDDAVRSGAYSFWGYEHFLYRSTLTGDQKTVADQISAQVQTADAVQSGLLIPTMSVSREIEGGVISPNN